MMEEKDMFCTKCGTLCTDEQRYCDNCGSLLELQAAPAAEAPAAEEAIIEEPVAEEPVVEEPVAVEPVAVEPLVQPPVQQPAPPARQQSAPAFAPVAPPAPAKGQSGAVKWMVRVLISVLPLLVTYLLVFLVQTGMFGAVENDFSVVDRTMSIVFLSIIGASVIAQVTMLIIWACGKDKAAHDWAQGFTIIALVVIVFAVLFSIGMHLFSARYYDKDIFAFLTYNLKPVDLIATMISRL